MEEIKRDFFVLKDRYQRGDTPGSMIRRIGGNFTEERGMPDNLRHEDGNPYPAQLELAFFVMTSSLS